MPLSVCIAEDNPELLQLYVEAMQMAGYEVQATDDGEEVLPTLEQKHTDILVLDLGLPNLDGLNILKWIRQASPLRQLKVVIITGRRDWLRHPEVELADLLLLKPIDIREVMSEVDKLAAFSA